MERMERFLRAQRRIAADVEEQRNIGKKNAKHMLRHATCAKNLSRPPRFEQDNPETQVPDANIRRDTPETRQSKSLYLS